MLSNAQVYAVTLPTPTTSNQVISIFAGPLYSSICNSQGEHSLVQIWASNVKPTKNIEALDL